MANIIGDSYQLLDTGGFRKLEQVGLYRLDRPAPQAVWRAGQDEEAWKTADAYYRRSKSGGGRWEYNRKVPETWTIVYAGLTLKVKLTDFGHLGFFAEHASYWSWVQKRIRAEKRPVRVLNMFAYTGGATLAAAAAGAQVTHLDSAKGIVSWARENAGHSGLSDKPVRWIVDDVFAYVEKEIRRGSKYEGLIIDPPSYGRGSKGEVWKFEDKIACLLERCRRILAPEPVFVLLSAHTPGFSPLALQNLLEDMTRGLDGKLSSMEMFITEGHSPRKLPSGIMACWQKE